MHSPSLPRPSVLLNVPSLQGSGADAPSSQYDPATHSKQAVLPVSFMNLPASHLAHVLHTSSSHLMHRATAQTESVLSNDVSGSLEVLTVFLDASQGSRVGHGFCKGRCKHSALTSPPACTVCGAEQCVFMVGSWIRTIRPAPTPVRACA